MTKLTTLLVLLLSAMLLSGCGKQVDLNCSKNLNIYGVSKGFDDNGNEIIGRVTSCILPPTTNTDD